MGGGGAAGQNAATTPAKTRPGGNRRGPPHNQRASASGREGLQAELQSPGYAGRYGYGCTGSDTSTNRVPVPFQFQLVVSVRGHTLCTRVPGTFVYLVRVIKMINTGINRYCVPSSKSCS